MKTSIKLEVFARSEIFSLVEFDSDDSAVTVCGFLGAKTTSFNTKEKVTATIARTIKDMTMILAR